jgi:hypothetical protein
VKKDKKQHPTRQVEPGKALVYIFGDETRDAGLVAQLCGSGLMGLDGSDSIPVLLFLSGEHRRTSDLCGLAIKHREICEGTHCRELQCTGRGGVLLPGRFGEETETGTGRWSQRRQSELLIQFDDLVRDVRSFACGRFEKREAIPARNPAPNARASCNGPLTVLSTASARSSIFRRN